MSSQNNNSLLNRLVAQAKKSSRKSKKASTKKSSSNTSSCGNSPPPAASGTNMSPLGITQTVSARFGNIVRRMPGQANQIVEVEVTVGVDGAEFRLMQGKTLLGSLIIGTRILQHSAFSIARICRDVLTSRFMRN